MAAITRTAVYSVKEAAVFPLLIDVEGKLPVYGRGVKCPAIQTVNLTENLTQTSLPGDGTIVDTQAEIDSVELSIEHGQVDHVMKAIVQGGLHRLLDDESQYIFGGSDQGNIFALVFRATKLGAPGADYIIRVWKLTAGTSGSNSANKQHKTNTFDAQASQLQGKVLHVAGNDWYVESVRSSNSAGVIDLTNPFPTLPTAYTALTVESVSVSEGDNDVAVDEAFTVEFSEPVDSKYVTSDYFFVVNRKTGQILDCTVSQTTDTVTVTPDADLTLSGEYALVVNKNVASAANKIALNQNLTISFTVVAS